MFHSFHHRNMRAVDLIGTEDCHDIHVLYKWIETFDHECACIELTVEGSLTLRVFIAAVTVLSVRVRRR